MKARAKHLTFSNSDSSLKAFTLVELLAVVGVMLIVLRLILPSLDGLLGGDAQAMARTQLIGDLNKARSLALERGMPVYVVFMPLYDKVIIVSGNKHKFFSDDTAANSLLGSQLTSYAIYTEYLPGDQPRDPSTKWLTDWKQLPSGHHLSSTDLDALPARVDVTYLKGKKPQSPNVTLRLPALKYNSRGELEGAGLRGVYFSVNKGGVFPPVVDGNGKYSVASADPPESLPNEARQWLHVNAITGRAEIEELTEQEALAGRDLSDRLGSRYNLYIFSAPVSPDVFDQDIIKDVNDGGTDIGKLMGKSKGARYRNGVNGWRGNGPWAPVGGDYPIRPDANGSYIPAFTNLPNRKDAVELKWILEKKALGIGSRKIGIRIESK